jgi:hypothetical protein
MYTIKLHMCTQIDIYYIYAYIYTYMHTQMCARAYIHLFMHIYMHTHRESKTPIKDSSLSSRIGLNAINVSIITRMTFDSDTHQHTRTHIIQAWVQQCGHYFHGIRTCKCTHICVYIHHTYIHSIECRNTSKFYQLFFARVYSNFSSMLLGAHFCKFDCVPFFFEIWPTLIFLTFLCAVGRIK